MSKNNLWTIWNNKVEDPGFIHRFFIDEIKIYNRILSGDLRKLDGRVKDLANSFNVSNETFFGFLLGIEPLLKKELKNLNHRDSVKIKIDLHALYGHLSQKLNYEHLVELAGWGSAFEHVEVADVSAQIQTAVEDEASVDNKTMWNSWKSKIQDIDFVHEFFSDEMIIYHWILSQEKPILVGNISELAKYFDVKEETFYGFLLGMTPFVEHDVKTLKNTDSLDISIDLPKLKEHLVSRRTCAHLLALEGWGSVGVGISINTNVQANLNTDTPLVSPVVLPLEQNDIVLDTSCHFDALRAHIFSSPVMKGIIAKLKEDYNRNDYIVFLSLCNGVKRATVVKGIGYNLESAWDAAEENARNLIEIEKFDLVWAKADIVCSTEEISLEKLNNEMINSAYPFFLRKGVALDRNFDIAFLEGEMNGAGLYNYYTSEQLQKNETDPKSQRLNLNAINTHLNASNLAPIANLPKVVTTFMTIGFFCDEAMGIHALHGGHGIEKDRRFINEIDESMAMEVITNVAKSLSNKIEQDGKFVYGYNPVIDGAAYTKNILRHADSVLSFIKAYRITKDDSMIAGIEAGIQHVIDNFIIYKSPDIAFVLDKQTDEIKLGGNGLAVSMLIEYMNCFETDCYLDISRHLANGILALQDKITGIYYHILNGSDFSLKEKSETIYYDGAATYALAQMYTFTKERTYLDAATLSVEDFIKRKYSKYNDHQVTYALNEITKYVSEPRYYEFALECAVDNLTELTKRTRVFITILPLLMASWQTYQRLLKKDIKVEYTTKLDAKRFAAGIFNVAHHLQNAYFYPEQAMYMKLPRKCKGAVYRREGSFQMKTDDIGYFIDGYQMYVAHYSNLRSILSVDSAQSLSKPENEKTNVPEIDSKVTGESLLQIGFLYNSEFVHPERDFFETNGYFKTLFYIATHYGLQLVLFSSDDIDFKTGMVQGTILVNGKPEKCITKIPQIIDNSLLANNRKRGFGDRLEEYAFTIRKSGSNKKTQKHEIYDMLLKDGKYADFLIPTKMVESFEDISQFENEEGIVIKKTDSHQGVSVMHISREKSRYKLILGQEHFDMTKAKLKDYYEKHIKGEKYLVQPFIKSITKHGEPFDVRLQARRTSDESFFVNPYVRIGNPKGIISNYAGGGHTLPFDAFLRANIDEEKRMELKNQIMQLGNEFSKHYANLFDDARIFDIGIDVGITEEDENFKLWIFEVNIYIGGHIYGLGDAKAHCTYFRYLADKLSNGSLAIGR